MHIGSHIFRFTRILIPALILIGLNIESSTAGLALARHLTTYTTTAVTTAVKSGPGENFKTNRSIPKGVKVKVVDQTENGRWLKIANLQDGHILGYIKTNKTQNSGNHIDALLGSNHSITTASPRKKTSSSANYLDRLLGAETGVAKNRPKTKSGSINNMLGGLNEEIEMATLEREIDAEIQAEKSRLEQEQREIERDIRREKRRMKRMQREAEEEAEKLEQERLEEVKEAKKDERRERRRRQAARDDREDNKRRREWAANLGNTAKRIAKQNEQIMRDTDAAFRQSKRIKQRQDRKTQYEYNQKQRTRYTKSSSNSNNDYNNKLANLKRKAAEKQNALKARKQKLTAKYEKRLAALNKKTAIENKREMDLRKRQDMLKNKQASLSSSKSNKIEALAFCHQTKYKKWVCDGFVQKTTAFKDVNTPLQHNHCANYRKKIPYNNGWVYFCNKMLNLDGKTGKMTWNRDITQWISFPQSILSQRKR